MDNDIYGIKCSCNSNIDVNGYWTKNDMQDECRDMGIPEDQWMSYLFSHIFSDYNEWTSEVEDAFIKNDCITQMKLHMGTDHITLEKIFK